MVEHLGASSKQAVQKEMRNSSCQTWKKLVVVAEHSQMGTVIVETS